ncbi:MAG: hypothetical protein AAFQ04_02240 [Pseudomonadota bacterium]
MTEQFDMPREEVEALLVFLANGSLEGEEREAVEAAVDADPDLQAQLQALKAMRESMQKEAEVQSPGEFGLARLLRDIEAETMTAPPAANIPAPPRFWKIAAMVVFGLFIAQTAYLGLSDGSGFELAGEEESIGVGPTLVVAFNPDATEAQIRALMLELDLMIIDGPSALGLYTLAATDEAARTAALSALKQRTRLIESVE